MKTIEERYGCANCHLVCCEGCDSFCLVKGATDQRDIDIEKAWQWMRQHIKLIGSEMELHSQFVKAMKDESK